MAEVINLSENEKDIFEAVIRFHFNDNAPQVEFIARIGIKGKDPSNNFLNRFSDYKGFFLPYSDLSALTEHNDGYFFSIWKLFWNDRNDVIVFATDGVSIGTRDLRFELSRNVEGNWTVTKGVVIDHNITDG